MSGSSQAELDLLADGRDVLERWCASPRYRYLYPEGPNLAVLLEAYQLLDRRRVLGRVRDRPRPLRRALRRLVIRLARVDALSRNQRLRWRYPPPRVRPPHVRPALVEHAIERVDPDARGLVRARLDGNWAAPDPSTTLHTEGIKEQRGLDQFREALINEALAQPERLAALHPQFLLFAASPGPRVRRYPIAVFLLVKLPMRLLMGLVVLLVTLYVGAYTWFNDERLGSFVSHNVSGLIEGELDMRRIHWELPLIVDLITGHPTHVVVDDATVWEPYASYGGERTRRTGFVRHLEAGLTLHEIIPWNRLGVPEAFEIPWELHLTDVRSDGEVWFVVREYDAVTDDGEERTLLSLIDAFRPALPTDPDRRGLSFRVRDATLPGITLDVDFMHGLEGWRTQALLRDVGLALHFEAPRVEEGLPPRLPLRFAMTGEAASGVFTLDDIEVPLQDFALEQVMCGMGDAAVGDVRFAGRGEAAGSPLSLRGTLYDAFARELQPGREPLPGDAEVEYGTFATVDLTAHSDDPELVAAHIEQQLGLAPGTIVAIADGDEGDDAELWAEVSGPLTEPRYHLAAVGLSLDLIGEPAWTMDDVAVSVDIGQAPVPDQWRDQVPHDARRLVARFDTFEGSALDGEFELDPEADEGAVVVFPEGGESFLISAPLRLHGINPAQLSPDDPDVAKTLAGQASGALDLRRLELGPRPEALRPPMPDPLPFGVVAPPEDDELSLLRAVMELRDVRLVRDRGPAADGMPRRIRADGVVEIGPEGEIDLDDLVLRTDGTELRASGGVDGDLSKLEDTLLQLRIDDGDAFARAFGLPPYFDQLDASLTLFGPTGAPSGRAGSLRLSGVGVQGGTETLARVSMDQGVLSVRAPQAQLFGGTGSVDADVTLMRGGAVLSDPLLRATVDLRGVELSTLVDAGLSGPADIRVVVGDEEGRATPLSRLRLRGEARVPQLRFGGTRYRDAVVRFTLEPERVVIDTLVLPVHRSVSPFHEPSLTVPIGTIIAHGSVGLQADPTLDLEVEAQGVPLRLVARLLDLDIPVRGRIGDGTRLDVSGSMRRPRVEGRVQLQGLSVEGLALGSGALEVTNQDLLAEGPLAAHRELRVTGELATPASADGGIQWTVDAVVALGETETRRGQAATFAPVDAEVDVRFDRLSLDTLLRGLSRGTDQTPPVTGRLDQLLAHVLTCDPGAAMLSDCVGEPRDERSLEVTLQLDEAWVGGHEPTTTDPCQDPTILCAPAEVVRDGRIVDNRLQASIDWPSVSLVRPWQWQTGGKTPAQLVLSGNLDLSTPEGSEGGGKSDGDGSDGSDDAEAVAAGCAPPPIDSLRPAPPVAGEAKAEVKGVLDMAVIAELLDSEELARARGRLKVGLALHGPAAGATVSGEITLAEPAPSDGAQEGMMLDLGYAGVQIGVDELEVRLDQHWVAARGQLQVQGEPLRFGSVGRDHTGFAFGGRCTGTWGLALDGRASARIINTLAGEGTATKGSVELPRVVAGGNVESDTLLERAEGSLRFGETALTLDLDEGLPGVELTAGQVDFELCEGDRCPAEIAPGSIALYVGGRTGARSDRRPGDALRAKVGPRGAAFAWGTVYLAPDAQSVDDTRVVVQLEDVPYREYDQRGRPVYEAEMSSAAVTLEGGVPLVVSGLIEVDRARYVQDAVQGVEILRFTDDVDLPSAPPPEIVRNLQFDLRVATLSPLRVENNVAHGVEANAVVEVTGTFDTPEFTGRVDVEPGGTVDIPFLTGTYEIQRGRVTLLRELADAEVDVLARREELVYIEDQPRQVYLLLGGTADAITWQCIAEGDTSGAVETQRGCLDYLVLGAGDVQTSSLTVQRTGGGGLANARKPLQVVGHVTEFDFGRRIEDAVPRLGPYVPDMRLRLGQIGPELEIATPQDWLDFDYAHGTLGLDYTRGYPGFLLQSSRELTFKLEAIDLLIFEVSRDIRSYLNNRIIFDPLRQTTVEFRVDFEIPSLR